MSKVSTRPSRASPISPLSAAHRIPCRHVARSAARGPPASKGSLPAIATLAQRRAVLRAEDLDGAVHAVDGVYQRAACSRRATHSKRVVVALGHACPDASYDRHQEGGQRPPHCVASPLSQAVELLEQAHQLLRQLLLA
eukprot:5165885-Prymnesium_polylepis.1